MCIFPHLDEKICKEIQYFTLLLVLAFSHPPYLRSHRSFWKVIFIYIMISSCRDPFFPSLDLNAIGGLLIETTQRAWFDLFIDSVEITFIF